MSSNEIKMAKFYLKIELNTREWVENRFSFFWRLNLARNNYIIQLHYNLLRYLLVTNLFILVKF